MSPLEESFTKSQFRPIKNLFLVLMFLMVAMFLLIEFHALTGIESDVSKKATERQFKGRPLTELENGKIYNWIFVKFIPKKGVELPTHLGTVSMCLTKQRLNEHLYAEFDNNSIRDENGEHTTKIPNPFRYKKEVLKIKFKDGALKEIEHWFTPVPKLERIQLINR